MKALFKHLRAAVRAIFDEFWGDALARAQHALTDAIKEQSRRYAETQYQSMLVGFYADEAGKIDPHQDWNTFASMKDKWQSHSLDLQVEARRLTEASAKFHACRKRLTTLRDKS